MAELEQTRCRVDASMYPVPVCAYRSVLLLQDIAVICSPYMHSGWRAFGQGVWSRLPLVFFTTPIKQISGYSRDPPTRGIAQGDPLQTGRHAGQTPPCQHPAFGRGVLAAMPHPPSAMPSAMPHPYLLLPATALASSWRNCVDNSVVLRDNSVVLRDNSVVLRRLTRM